MNSKPIFRAGGVQRGAPVLAGPVTYLADVSEWEPDIADAAYLAWSKAIVIRAAYGDQHDDKAWYGGARRDALHAGGAKFVGIYQYLVAGQDGGAQAARFTSLVGAPRPGEVFIADFEEGSRAILTAWYNEMLVLHGQGIAPYLWTYTGLNFGEAQGALPVQWLADYTSIEPGSPHTLWQFTNAYSVPGVGRCDCSMFHGTVDELAALAWSAPKPWTFPAPGGLHVVKQTREGYSFAWDAVTGPSGQKPISYSAYTYNTAGGLMNHQVVAGLATSEYGPAGTGLPAGTYRTNVWANGAPLGPAHSTVQVTLQQLRPHPFHLVGIQHHAVVAHEGGPAVNVGDVFQLMILWQLRRRSVARWAGELPGSRKPFAHTAHHAFSHSLEAHRMTDKSLHDEVTELTAAVRELRDRELAETVRELRAEVEKLRAERAGHCGCTHIHQHGWWPTLPYQPYTVTYSTGSYVSTEPVSTGTLAASGVPTWGEHVYDGPAGATVMGSGYTVSATN